MTSPRKPVDVSAAIAKLEAVLRARSPAVLAAIGGPIAFLVVNGEPREWTVRFGHSVEIVPVVCIKPAARIGIRASALQWLVEGTLDAERAFKQGRLAIEGDLRVVGRFAAAFALPTRWIDQLARSNS